MDSRLEALDKMLAHAEDDPARELSFAIRSADEHDPATLYWLAACAVSRAAELEEIDHAR